MTDPRELLIENAKNALEVLELAEHDSDKLEARCDQACMQVNYLIEETNRAYIRYHKLRHKAELARIKLQKATLKNNDALHAVSTYLETHAAYLDLPVEEDDMHEQGYRLCQDLTALLDDSAIDLENQNEFPHLLGGEATIHHDLKNI
tara:strand:- start:163 stop:606 length:444 start_codon:yes stop_codon:yes gene_type:complete